MENLIKHEARMNDTVRSDDAGVAPARPRVRRRLSAQEARDRRRRVVTWALSIMLGVLLVNAFVGESGYLANLQAQRDEAALRASVARLRYENQSLQEQSRRLREDPTAIEEAARRDLGMIRPGETLIILRDATGTAPASASH
jgi:cell division protein FtsB